jgi:hypothetical protein
VTENEAFVTAHINALWDRDLVRALRDYDEASVLRTDHGENRGLDQIGDHLRSAVAGSPEGATFDRTVETDGEGRVVLRWQLTGPDGRPLMVGHDTFVIADNVIREQEVFLGS